MAGDALSTVAYDGINASGQRVTITIYGPRWHQVIIGGPCSVAVTVDGRHASSTSGCQSKGAADRCATEYMWTFLGNGYTPVKENAA